MNEEGEPTLKDVINAIGSLYIRVTSNESRITHHKKLDLISQKYHPH